MWGGSHILGKSSNTEWHLPLLLFHPAHDCAFCFTSHSQMHRTVFSSNEFSDMEETILIEQEVSQAISFLSFLISTFIYVYECMVCVWCWLGGGKREYQISWCCSYMRLWANCQCRLWEQNLSLLEEQNSLSHWGISPDPQGDFLKATCKSG